MVDPAITDLAPVGDQLQYCDWCRLWKHKTNFDAGARSCRWCRAAFKSRRDHGIRKGLYSAEELVKIVAMIDPPSPWLPGDVYHQDFEPVPTIQDLNAPFVGEDEAKEIPEITQEPRPQIWVPNPGKT